MNELPTAGNSQYSCPASVVPKSISQSVPFQSWDQMFVPGQLVIVPILTNRAKVENVNRIAQYVCHDRFQGSTGWVFWENKCHKVDLNKVTPDTSAIPNPSLRNFR